MACLGWKSSTRASGTPLSPYQCAFVVNVGDMCQVSMLPAHFWLDPSWTCLVSLLEHIQGHTRGS